MRALEPILVRYRIARDEPGARKSQLRDEYFAELVSDLPFDVQAELALAGRPDGRLERNYLERDYVVVATSESGAVECQYRLARLDEPKRLYVDSKYLLRAISGEIVGEIGKLSSSEPDKLDGVGMVLTLRAILNHAGIPVVAPPSFRELRGY